MENHLSSRRAATLAGGRVRQAGRDPVRSLSRDQSITAAQRARERDEKCEEFSLREKKVTRTLSATHTLCSRKNAIAGGIIAK